MHASALSVFQFQSYPVRTLQIDEAPWFVASDIAKVLGYRDAEQISRHLDADEKRAQIVDVQGGTIFSGTPPKAPAFKGTRPVSTLHTPQRMTIISESGMYAAVLRSNRPEANKFRKWVTSVVLPAIRKNGAYAAPVETAVEEPNSIDPKVLRHFIMSRLPLSCMSQVLALAGERLLAAVQEAEDDPVLFFIDPPEPTFPEAVAQLVRTSWEFGDTTKLAQLLGVHTTTAGVIIRNLHDIDRRRLNHD
jgi:prophage antirepressor-like protein